MYPLASLFPPTKQIRRKFWRGSLLLLALTLVCSGAAKANTIWQNGDVITFTQATWGLPVNGAAVLLSNNFASVYAATFGTLEVGIPGTAGFSMVFSGAPAVISYLPQAGPIGALNADLINPTLSSSGTFGGEVTALRLNIDFSDAGVLLGNSKIPFGNLVLANFSTLPALDGLTVRQFDGIVETLLGGGSASFSISELYPVAVDLNDAFLAGTVSTFAQSNLVAPSTVAPVPEPSTLLLLGTGLLGLVGVARKKWLG